jgi:hypothetical protein
MSDRWSVTVTNVSREYLGFPTIRASGLAISCSTVTFPTTTGIG